MRALSPESGVCALLHPHLGFLLCWGAIWSCGTIVSFGKASVYCVFTLAFLAVGTAGLCICLCNPSRLAPGHILQCGHYQLMHLPQDLCYPFFQVLCTSQNIPQSSMWTKGVCLFRPSPPCASVPLAILTTLLSNLSPVCSDPASRMTFLNPVSPHFFPLKTLLGLLLPPSNM